MKFCVVASRGAKEMEDHLRSLSPKTQRPWHPMSSVVMKAVAGWGRTVKKVERGCQETQKASVPAPGVP